MQQMAKQLQKMQAQVAAAQAALVEARVEGTAGGGLVTATVSGTGEVVGLVIKPEAVDPDDVETLSDLVVAAFLDAQRASKEMAEAAMPAMPAGLGF
jgi:DNA-binding YbaB/EbfC family protein